MASAAAKRIIPLFDRVLIQRVKAPERTSSGLFIPEKAQANGNEGLVLAVGPGAPGEDGKVRPVVVKQGDRVLLPAYGGEQIKIGEEELLLFRDRDILATFTK